MQVSENDKNNIIFKTIQEIEGLKYLYSDFYPVIAEKVKRQLNLEYSIDDIVPVVKEAAAIYSKIEYKPSI